MRRVLPLLAFVAGLLAAGRGLLESVKGVGRQTATTLLAELPPVGQLSSAESAAAYCGLAPREFRSGASVRRRTRLSKAGNARLRKALYLPAVTAVRFNPRSRGFFRRPVAARSRAGRWRACALKLEMTCYGVLTEGGRPESRPAPSGNPNVDPA